MWRCGASRPGLFRLDRAQCALQHDGHFSEIDVEHLAEEIEDLGKRDQREVRERLEVLLTHLFKWRTRFSGDADPSWLATIEEQRTELDSIFEQSPSLAGYGRQSLLQAYFRAAQKAMRETELPRSAFPAECPFTFEQLIDEEFLPE